MNRSRLSMNRSRCSVSWSRFPKTASGWASESSDSMIERSENAQNSRPTRLGDRHERRKHRCSGQIARSPRKGRRACRQQRRPGEGACRGRRRILTIASRLIGLADARDGRSEADVELFGGGIEHPGVAVGMPALCVEQADRNAGVAIGVLGGIGGSIGILTRIIGGCENPAERATTTSDCSNETSRCVENRSSSAKD
jgi:hypothetical protein